MGCSSNGAEIIPTEPVQDNACEGNEVNKICKRAYPCAAFVVLVIDQMMNKFTGVKPKGFFLSLMIFFSFSNFGLSAQHLLKGEVRDEITGMPIQGVLLRIEDTFSAAVSEANGKFSLKIHGEKMIRLTLSHIAYEKVTMNVEQSDAELMILLKPRTYLSREINVEATRAGDFAPFSFSNIGPDEIGRSNLGQDMPYLLRNTPSVLTTSDAGTGIGYSALRIRGSDGTRINVTLNGIPVNDAESHQVYWVDLPDLASSTESIQIQRGAGTSSNGAGSFGGSINVQTLLLRKEAYASLHSSAGSYKTFKNTIGFGTGLIRDHFAFDGRLSMLNSDGYIDRSGSELRSFYFSGAYYGKNASVKALIISGTEKTSQAWYGVPEDSLKKNRTHNPAGMYVDSKGAVQFYEDQTDNYQQDNYQLHYNQVISESLYLNLALHATKGKGYYEEYKVDDAYGDYGLSDVVAGTDTISYSDFIRQRWLDNLFYGSVVSLNYHSVNTKVIVGGAINQYDGKHVGELLWTKNMAPVHFPYRYYEDDALKREASLFLKLQNRIANGLTFSGDLQGRIIHYEFEGRESGGGFLPQKVNYSFINPKAGITYTISQKHQVYLSAGIARKEPVRDDFIDSSPQSRPEPEHMTDFEAGYRIGSEKYHTNLTFYFMNYRDQLILNGKINDVGEYTRQNVDDSYRTGIELESGFQILPKLNLELNLTVSKNKIRHFEEYIDDYDEGQQILTEYKETDIAFSPSVIAFGGLSWKPIEKLRIDLSGKYAGEQFLDNTSNRKRMIDDFFVTDFLLNYSISLKGIREAGISIQVNNLFDTRYSSNGYTYSYKYGGETSTFNYYYPQAGRNFMAGMKLMF
jgi:iron complex outermembrane receptor protein